MRETAMIYTVTVAVALRRPPVIDEYRRYVVQADSAPEATLIALQIASCTCVMPVWSEVTQSTQPYVYPERPDPVG